MIKVLITVAVACGVGFSQTSKLKGKRIYMSRQESGHQNGYEGLRDLLLKNKAAYGFEFEYSPSPLTETALNSVYSRLYKTTGVKDANTIDILIFCQGEGDRNVAGNPYPGAGERMSRVNTHVRNGGAFIMVHGAGGREVSWHSWTYGAKLMTDWFVDDYRASSLIQGNGGHFSAGTKATYTLDEETLPARDSSTFFIRKLLTLPKAQNGLGQPLVTDQVESEWYHFNGGKQFEDGSGSVATHPNNKVMPKPVRGDMGVPDSGIGPAKIMGLITKIQGANYTPPGKGRHSVWGREVSKGPFDAKTSAENGRFVYFNPGHNGNEYTLAGNWIGDFFLSTLRWVVKDDRGCTDATRANYNAMATVNDGTCTPTVSSRDALLSDGGSAQLGRISVRGLDLDVSVNHAGAHSVAVVGVDGRTVFSRLGEGAATYPIANLQRGFYLAHVKVAGRSFKKLVSIQ